MSHFHKLITLAIAFIALNPVLLIAQPGAPPATPIDGGLSMLLAAGGIYGAKKLLKKNK